MVNLKAGLAAAIGTVVVVITELILFPIALTFLSSLNDSPFLSASDRTILAKTPTLMIVIVLFTLIAGMIVTIALAVRG